MPTLGGNIATTLGTTGVSCRQLDILPLIINQDPTDTPFFELSGMATAKAREHSWQTRGLRSRANRSFIEGSDFTYSTVSAPTRVTNFTQIIMDGVEISGSLQQEVMYGANDVMRDQINLRSVEHRNDIEFSLIRSTSAIGDTDTAQTMAGLIAAAGTTNSGVGDTFTETKFVGYMEAVWQTGAKPNTALVNTKIQNEINGFAGDNATKWIDVTTREIVNQVLVYHTSYGSVMVYLSRDLTNTANATGGAELVLFDKSMTKKAWFRTTKLIPAGIIGDYERVGMVSELTFQYDNNQAIYYWSGYAVE